MWSNVVYSILSAATSCQESLSIGNMKTMGWFRPLILSLRGNPEAIHGPLWISGTEVITTESESTGAGQCCTCKISEKNYHQSPPICTSRYK